MIVSLGREFGIPISDEDLHQPSILENNTLESHNGQIENDLNEPDTQQHQLKICQPLDMTNEAYEEMLENRKLEQSLNPVDYINANIVRIFIFEEVECFEMLNLFLAVFIYFIFCFICFLFFSFLIIIYFLC